MNSWSTTPGEVGAVAEVAGDHLTRAPGRQEDRDRAVVLIHDDEAGPVLLR